MKKILKVSILLIVSALLGFVYGYFVHRNKIFPYKYIQKAQMANIYRQSMQWSIGVFEGPSPFSLSDSKNINNPVLTDKDVNDTDAAFVADPFSFVKNGEYFMFFEVLNMNTYSGDIGYATSENGLDWHYGKIIIDEEFHLSFPCVYEWNGDYYMIPESSEDFSVRLYKAKSFPEQWEYVGNLLSDSPFVDPIAFQYNNKWWMLTSTPDNDVLNLYFSDSLTSGWQEHPINPLVENNKHLARPAGRVFEYENKLYRLAQDDAPFYGIQVYAIEITELSETVYKENINTPILIVTMSQKGWNAAGMHQVDLFKIGNNWHAVVDGLKRRP